MHTKNDIYNITDYKLPCNPRTFKNQGGGLRIFSVLIIT